MKTFVQYTNGEKMPISGLGLFMRNPTDPKSTVETSMDAALETGIRHFDTAYFYANEDIIGAHLKKWFEAGKVKREELFITTKLPSMGMHADKVEQFIKKSLTALRLDYIDLYLVHSPIGTVENSDGVQVLDKNTNLEVVWKEMEKQVEAGRTKSIGVSNFSVKQLERVLKIAKIHPENIQVELHAYFQQKQLREFCEKHKITICSYGSLGSPGRRAAYDGKGMYGVVPKELPPLLDDPIINQIAKKYNKSAGQILLKFLVQLDVVVIPKSANPVRVKQNFDIFDFELSKEDMALLETLDKGDAGRSFNFDIMPGWQQHPEYPF